MAFDERRFKTRLRELYPAVKDETLLPIRWNPKDKFKFISLSQDYLKVHYKGQGRTHRDAASIRSTHSIPSSCGVFYFEVTVLTKGRDGYIGIGISGQDVNLNRLPGWDKYSYGYHGDDGHSFCATGTGHQYGPTFTTGDTIGCGLNFIDNSCFYTKNGVNIGVAFRDLPNIPFFPTVGLQTPNEELLANFGQQSFLYDFEDYLKELKTASLMSVDNYDIQDKYGYFQTVMHKLVSSYLIHHGYVASTEAFNCNINEGQDHFEDIASIKSRQKIQKLVLSGKIGEAIEATDRLFPGLLAKSYNLLFLLKVRQLIEMINGTHSEIDLNKIPSSSVFYGRAFHPKNRSFSSNQTQIQSPEQGQCTSPTRSSNENPTTSRTFERSSEISTSSVMETDSDYVQNSVEGQSNGVLSNGFAGDNGSTNNCDIEADREQPLERSLCGGNQLAIQQMMKFGQELFKMSKNIEPEETRRKSKNTLQEAFSLLAYMDPWSSPVGYQLDPVQREPICAALNSRILELQNLPKRPQLLSMIGQTQQCLQKMLSSKIGTAVFVSVSDYLH